MKHFVAIILAAFFTSYLFAQNNQTEVLDTAVINRINREVSIEALQFKKILLNNRIDNERVAFCVDTFIIKHIELGRINANGATYFVNKTLMSAINAYNALLQDYYIKLDALLLTSDKTSLLSSKNAWLNFQKAEVSFIGTLTKVNYSGGGTIQTNIEAKLDEKIVIDRLDQIFNYYDTVIQNK